MRARIKFLTSESVLVCRPRALNSPATSVGLADANSSEFDQATPHRVIYKLRELRGVEELGGTMRLGAWTCKIEPNTLAHKIYGKLEISERHRHRYEFNREYEEPMVAAGCASPAQRPTAPTLKWSNCRTTPISSDASFIPNSNRSRWSRIHCSARSSLPPTSTAQSGARKKRRLRWKCFTVRKKSLDGRQDNLPPRSPSTPRKSIAIWVPRFYLGALCELGGKRFGL